MRQARLLLGWQDDNQGAYYLSGQQGNAVLTEDQRKKLEKARRAVEMRPVRVEKNPLKDPPGALRGHIEALTNSAPARVFFQQGWKVMLADLREVRAIQPVVFSDYAEASLANVDINDPISIASASLPLPTNVNLPASYDPQRQAWIISSPNLNLQITGGWGGQVQVLPGNAPTVFGFTIATPPSFLQVAKFRGRYILRDGNHRAHGFLTKNISQVPCLFKEFGEHEELGVGPLGLLPANVFLGDRPAMLGDYSNDDVSVDVSLPSALRSIIIPGLQINQNT